MNTSDSERQSFWWSPQGIALLVFLGAAAFFLWTEHQAHVFGALPLLILLLCVVMHFFMHAGHGGHGTHGGDHRVAGGDDER
jgi:hypothetical protein